MRSRVEAGGFELLPDVGEGGLRLIREREFPSIDESIDVIHAKANGFHVERSNGEPQRFAFFEDAVPRRALRLILHTGDQPLEAILSGSSVISGISHSG